MVSKRIDIHHVAKYDKIESDIPVAGAMTFGGLKLLLIGRPSFEYVTDSYKYHPEIQITLWNHQGSVKLEKRTPYAGQYDRIEIFLPKDECIEMCKAILENVEQPAGQPDGETT